ncbi:MULTISPECIES: TetR/AcrR family transcriptional regulator [unclassified Phaeobacter]|uniref:TetR/AcrR family transcriptional regulator n=1 Tax=unclassified Phaeobacter TaxID=2621772 RepID=UPI003A8B2966
MARTIAKDHDHKRAQILKSAAKVFAEEGFDRASMTQLARECGISKANIYHYYDSKDAVLFGLLDTYLSALRDRVCTVDVTGLSPEQRLRRIVSEILLAYQGADHEHQVQISAMGALPEAQQKLLRAYQRELVQLVSDALAGVAAPAIARDPARLRAVTMSVFGMLNWYYMWNSGAGPEAREDYAQMVADLTMNGIRAL